MGKGSTGKANPSRATCEVLEEDVSAKGAGIHPGDCGR